MRELSKNGVILYLRAVPEHIYRNVANDKSRPLLEGHDKMRRISELMRERTPLYEKYADLTVSVSGDTVKKRNRKNIVCFGGEKNEEDMRYTWSQS